ncbi:hypothetical protein QTO34_005533 [Cnephaeus nilssonii]|uniref:Uncharacterized protein n=1 Tax=Cnephaeus nilssonii TaxID=3371016 RepID=A0AA40HPG5_CNENI|nr:hypothetical protein QTO34_005533 [Eptesicus nilssonii]
MLKVEDPMATSLPFLTMEPNRTWNPGNQAATFYNCPFPSHSDKDIGEDTMFSCCLPVCRGRGLKRGSDESIFRRARRWIRTQSRRRLWPFARRDPARSTQIKVGQQLVQEDPFPMSRSGGPVSHTTEGQGRPEVRVVTWAAGEPGPVGGWRKTPPPKPPRPNKPPTSKPLSPNMRMAIFNSILKYYADVNDTRPEDLEPKQAEPKGEKVGSTSPGGRGGSSVTREAHPETGCELEASPPPELLPPPAASPDAAVEPGPAPEETEAPAPLDEEPSLEPMLAPASEEELPVEGPAQGPKGEKHQPRRQRRLLLMQSWRHLHLQSFHHLQQPLQLQLWSQGRPQKKPRP